MMRALGRLFSLFLSWISLALIYLGERFLFFKSILIEIAEEGLDWRQTQIEVSKTLRRSIPNVLFMGFFIGGIMAIQIDAQLKDFGAEGYLGGISTSVTLRNVGPVFIAFILSGNVGAFTAAELASLRTTGQIEALTSLGISPFRVWICPRLVGVSLASAILLLLGLFATLWGGILISEFDLHMDPLRYLSQIPKIVTPGSLVMATLKSVVFGVGIAIIGCYEGYVSPEGRGVGKAVQNSALACTLFILFTNFMISSLVGTFLELEGIR